MKLEKVVYFDYVGIRDISLNGGLTISIDVGSMNLKDYKKLIKMEGEKVKLILKVEEPILDKAERKYLSGVIKPFRNEIEYIMKLSNDYYKEEYILIIFKDGLNTPFPYFKKGKMYKGMELDKKYTLEELKL